MVALVILLAAVDPGGSRVPLEHLLAGFCYSLLQQTGRVFILAETRFRLVVFTPLIACQRSVEAECVDEGLFFFFDRLVATVRGFDRWFFERKIFV